MAGPLDVLMRPAKFVKSDRVYTIILAEGTDYATANPDSDVTLIATQTNPEWGGITGYVSATLLESSRNAGADFATLNATAGTPGGAERVSGIVVPKSEDARANWLDWYVKPLAGFGPGGVAGEIPTQPFLWQVNVMEFNAPRSIGFKIRYAPHIGPAPGSVPMVQMYPATTATTSQMGWIVSAYRIDKGGTAAMFQAPPEWYPDVISMFGERGLLFGTDPPLIAADVPF